MVRRLLIGPLVVIATVGIALAQVPVKETGAIDHASEDQLRIYEDAVSDESWLEGKIQAGEAYNRDDQLLEQVMQVRQSAKAIVGREFMDQIQDRSGADRYLDVVRGIEEHTIPNLERTIEEMIGGDPQIQSILEAGLAQQSDEPPPARYILAATRAMGEENIQALMEIAKHHDDMVIVFRGLMPGEKIEDLVRFLMKLQPPIEGAPMANVMIEPTVFSGVGITVAPTLLRLDDEGAVIAEVRGLANPDWIEERVQAGELGDLGKHGDTVAIVEEDMIETMKRQFAESNVTDHLVKQKDNFWKLQRQFKLPTASVERTREVDPTVVVVDGIYGPDGTVLAYPGEKLNPFDAIPFTMTVIVFNGTDSRQVAWAREKVVELEGRELTLVTSEVDPVLGWDGYNNMISTIGRHVYLLPPDMVERFQLEAVPSTVEGGDRVLVVKEYALLTEPGSK